MSDIHSWINSIVIFLGFFISLFNLYKWFENSYPKIKVDFKYKKSHKLEFNIVNVGTSTAHDVNIYLSTGWGKPEPDRLHISKLLPNQEELRELTLPEDKSGAVYTLALVIRGYRKILFWKLKFPEIKKNLDLDQKKIFDDFWFGSLPLK